MRNEITAPRTFWVDVEDLISYFDINPRLSGVQRVVFQILKVLPARARLSIGTPRIVFVRHTGDEGLLQEVTFDSVAKLFEERRDGGVGGVEKAAVRNPEPPSSSLRLGLIRAIGRLPPEISKSLLRAGIHQKLALRHIQMLTATMVLAARSRPAAPTVSPDTAPLGKGRFAGQAGDVFLTLGAPWVNPNYDALLHRLRTQYQLETALLLYDLIPVRHPEWCAADLVKSFGAWLTTTLPHCDRLMAISHATAADVEAYIRHVGLKLNRDAVQPVPIGTGFSLTGRGVAKEEPRPRGLPWPGSYVLFVSTLEARKNHALMFRVWRRLLSELPADKVPTLVFAGRVGWLVADLLQQIENTNWLEGKIRFLRDPTDAELVALYRGCQFTVFPSLFEGWGLPVSESLALGRPCIASNRTSLPEAGGELARYFDPDNLDDAYRVVRDVIEHPAELEAWRERVAHEFRHVPWEHTADAILAACLPNPPSRVLEKSS